MSNFRKYIKPKPPEFLEDSKIVCKTFGCGKYLTPMEFLYSEFCFKCNQNLNEMSKSQQSLFEKSKWTCKLFKWSSLNNIWEHIKTMSITENDIIYSEGEVIEHLSKFYRYDIFKDGIIFKSFYHYSPNKFYLL